MMSFKIGRAFALCVGLLASAQAAEFQYYVVPLKGLTGISQSALKNDGPPGPKYSGMIDQKYADYFFDDGAQKGLANSFVASVAKAYPKAVIGANQVVASGKSGGYAYDATGTCSAKPLFQVGYQHVYAMSLGISRLSAYVNDYGGKTQILVPVTYTIRFIKLNGASIIFSKSETIYTGFDATRNEFYDASGKEIAPAVLQRIKESVLNDANVVMARLVDSAVKSFTPKQSAATLIGRDGPYYIFDKGSEVGFKSGKEFYASDESGKNEYGFAIKYATERIAVGVASKMTGLAAPERLSTGTKLNFEFESLGVDDAKLSILAVQYNNSGMQALPQDQVISNALQSILVDDLGFKAPFNVIKQDPDFYRLKLQIRGEANCASEMYETMPGFSATSTEGRADPDLLFKLDHFSSPLMTVTGVGGVTSNTIFDNAVSLSLLDMSGVVRQNFIGSNNYVLNRTDGKGLSPQQAKEVNLKNAGLNAIKDLVAGFSPKKRMVKVVSVQQGVATLDAQIAPESFKQFRLSRPINVGNRQILLPILSKDEDGVLMDPPAEISNKISFRGALKVGDILVQPYADDGLNPVKLCQRAGVFLMTPALKNPSGLEQSLRYAVGADLKSYDFVEDNADFLRSTEYALNMGSFNTRQVSVPSKTAVCLLPLELQQAPKLTCAAGKCAGSASVASGVRIFNADTKVGESVVGATFEINDIPESELSGFVGLKMFEHHLKSINAHKLKLK